MGEKCHLFSARHLDVPGQFLRQPSVSVQNCGGIVLASSVGGRAGG